MKRPYSVAMEVTVWADSPELARDEAIELILIGNWHMPPPLAGWKVLNVLPGSRDEWARVSANQLRLDSERRRMESMRA